MWSSFNSNKTIAISPSILLYAVATGLGLWFLYSIRPILILLFLAFIIMVALNPGVSKVQRWTKLPRALSTAIVYLLVLVALIGMIGLVVPPMLADFYQLVRTFNLPFMQSELAEVDFTLAEISALVDRVGDSVGMVFAIVASTFTGAFTFVTLLVMSFYLILDRPYLHLKVRWFTHKKSHLDLVQEFLNRIELELGGWVRGQFILMLVIGAITYTGLAIIGVPYALPLAVLAGLLEILPNLGPTIAAVPAVILAFLTAGWFGAGVTTLFYIIVQQFENNLIVPKILKDNADVNPLVAIVTILIGLKLGGVIGAMLSIPAYIILRTIYGFWYRIHHQNV